MSKDNNNEVFHKTNINWFPGHMAKARREIKESLKLVDLTAEIVDARIPISSINSEIDEICKIKPRIIVLNKVDLISKESLNKWLEFYEKINIPCVSFSIKDGNSRKKFENKVKSIMQEKIDLWKSKGMLTRKVRVMIVGIPNVGKSSFINSFVKSSKAKVENKPGVTRKNQWICVGKEIEFLDTPGVLQSKINGEKDSYNLALTGAIKDIILDKESLGIWLIDILKNNYIENLSSCYKLDCEEIKDLTAEEILNLIGKKRGMMIRGGNIDTQRACNVLIEEFRSGKIGKILLEMPQLSNL